MEKETATHSSILAWEILWKEESGRLQSMGSQESNTTLQLNDSIILNRRLKAFLQRSGKRKKVDIGEGMFIYDLKLMCKIVEFCFVPS